MSYISGNSIAERIRSFFLLILFLSIPFSIAGDDFAIIGLYVCTIYLIYTKKERWISTRMQYAVLILLLGATLATLASTDISSGFRYFRSFWRFGLPFLVFLALKNRRVDPYLKVTLVISCIVAVYASIQFFTGLDVLRSPELQKQYYRYGKVWNAVGVFSHHLTYGGVSLVLFSLFTPSAFNKSLEWKKRLFFALGSICNLAAAFFTLGRSIWLGVTATIVTMILIQIRIRTLVITICLLSIGYGGYHLIDSDTKYWFYNQTTVGWRLNSITNMQANKDRLMMWQAAVNMIRDNPILGLGPGNETDKQAYYDRLSKEQNHRFQHTASVGFHNIYLQTWVDFGLLGLIGYLSWWILILIEILQTLKKSTPVSDKGKDGFLKGLFAGFVGIMVAGVFENNFRDGEVQTAIFTAMGLALALIYQLRHPELVTQAPQEEKTA